MKQTLPAKILLAFFLITGFKSFAQFKDSTAHFSFSGYADVYYAYYTDSLAAGEFQKFPTVSPRSNSPGLNTVVLTVQYDASRVRGMAAVHFGDIPSSTWSPNFNFILEAHAGVRLVKTLWIDAGFFRTHFGTEGLLPKENICSSISVNTFYEPYYEAGVRASYSPCDKLSISAYLLNGYNLYIDNNRKKSAAFLITYALGNAGNIGYSNYIGDDTPRNDSTPNIKHLRIHNNVFFNYQVKNLKIQVGADVCYQQNATIGFLGQGAATMFSGVASLKYMFPQKTVAHDSTAKAAAKSPYQLVNKFAIYGRGEIFRDPQGFMSTIILDNTGMPTGYKLWGATLGLEYCPTENTYIRLESRLLKMDKAQEIFWWNSAPRAYRVEVGLNMGVSF